jgi:hypothetical protein
MDDSLYLLPVSLTVQRIYHAREQETEERRTYLGASVIGAACHRWLWYDFRWACPPEEKSGRVRRLLETGDIEEARLIADLRSTGATVLEKDPKTGGQFGFTDIGGHFRGHMDGQAIGVTEAPKKWHVVEAKSHNDKSFGKLLKHGVAASKPLHFAQMQIYMHYADFSRAIYLAVNKNDDELYSARFNYDGVFAVRLVAKAEAIITARRPPARMHDSLDSKLAKWECGICPARSECHEGAFSERNCRTCCHSTPMLDGDARWVCDLHQIDLDAPAQRAGCENHIFIPDLVPGRPVALNKRKNWVRYRLDDGDEWTDGNAEENT